MAAVRYKAYLRDRFSVVLVCVYKLLWNEILRFVFASEFDIEIFETEKGGRYISLEKRSNTEMRSKSSQAPLGRTLLTSNLGNRAQDSPVDRPDSSSFDSCDAISLDS